MNKKQFNKLMDSSSPAFVIMEIISVWWKGFLQYSSEYSPEAFDIFVQEEIKTFSLDYDDKNIHLSAIEVIYTTPKLKFPELLLETGMSRETAKKIADLYNVPPNSLVAWIKEPSNKLLGDVIYALEVTPTKKKLEVLLIENTLNDLKRLRQYIGSQFTVPLREKAHYNLLKLLEPGKPVRSTDFKHIFKVMDALTENDAMEYAKKAYKMKVLETIPDILDYLVT